jgi:hypothetical protein
MTTVVTGVTRVSVTREGVTWMSFNVMGHTSACQSPSCVTDLRIVLMDTMKTRLDVLKINWKDELATRKSGKRREDELEEDLHHDDENRNKL